MGGDRGRQFIEESRERRIGDFGADEAIAESSKHAERRPVPGQHSQLRERPEAVGNRGHLERCIQFRKEMGTGRVGPAERRRRPIVPSDETADMDPDQPADLHPTGSDPEFHGVPTAGQWHAERRQMAGQPSPDRLIGAVDIDVSFDPPPASAR